MKERKRPPTAIDLFSGCGGMSLGIMMGGWNVVAAVEHSPEAALTYWVNLAGPKSKWIGKLPHEHRRANTPIVLPIGGSAWRSHSSKKTLPVRVMICDDIRNWTGKQILKTVGLKKIDAIFGGPPCQGFTLANSRTRSLEDPRSKLMWEFLRVVGQIHPKIFEIENVPGMLAYKDFTYLLMKTLERKGYVVRIMKFDCCSYGVPQHRVRILIQGIRKDLKKLPLFPVPTHFDPSQLKMPRKNYVSQAEIAKYAFAVNGFDKKELWDLWWNEKLQICMNRKTAGDVIDYAFTKCMTERILDYLASKRKRKRRA